MRITPDIGRRTLRFKLVVALLGAVVGFVPAALALRSTVAKTPGKKRAKPAFVVKGKLRKTLRPGTSQRLNLLLMNRRRFPLAVTRLRVRLTIDRAHRLAGCSPRRDFRVVQMRRRAYPIRLPRRAKRRLTRAGVRKSQLPRVVMRNLPNRNQDACKGAKLRLRYSGRTRRAKPRRRGAPAARVRLR